MYVDLYLVTGLLCVEKLPVLFQALFFMIFFLLSNDISAQIIYSVISAFSTY